MCFGRIIVICGLLAAFAYVNSDNTEAQIKRYSSVLQSRTGWQAAAMHPTAPAMVQMRDMTSRKIMQLIPSLIPAAGPGGAQGVGYFFYNDVDTSLISGSLVVKGLVNRSLLRLTRLFRSVFEKEALLRACRKICGS
jgi:hypothetical protein